MNSATVFAPSPTLTVTIESHPSGDDVHLHAGGQGVWQARMLTLLGVDVTLCALLSGESGLVIRTLLEREGITIDAIERGDATDLAERAPDRAVSGAAAGAPSAARASASVCTIDSI